MLGYVYLILATLLGREITRPLLPEQRIKEKEVTPCWITFSAAFGCGVLFLTWAVYIAAWLFSACGETAFCSQSSGTGGSGASSDRDLL